MAGMSLSGLMFSSIPAPRISPVGRGPLSCADGCASARVPHTTSFAHTPRNAGDPRQCMCSRALSNPVRRAGQHARRASHERAHRGRQLRGAARSRARAVCHLVGPHCLKYRTAAAIARGQPPEVLIEMTFDLALRLDDKAQARPVAHERGQGADGKGARIPQGIQQARSRVELPQPRLAPGEVIGLLPRGLEEQLTRRLRPGDQSLAVVERLSRDFASMVDTHERGCPVPLRLGQPGALPWRLGSLPWDGSGSLSGSEQGAQCTIGGADARVEKVAGLHTGSHYKGHWHKGHWRRSLVAKKRNYLASWSAANLPQSTLCIARAPCSTLSGLFWPRNPCFDARSS